MTGARIVAAFAVSGLGEGDAAFEPGPLGAPPRVVIAHDEELASAGLARPRAARVALDDGGVDRATALLTRALAGCLDELDDVRPGWRRARIGVAIGTSSGGMRSAERLFAERAAGRPIDPELARRATYFAPFRDALDAASLAPVRVTQVLGACAASTIALGLGARWLDARACDVVLAGGYDAISVFVAAGFEGLGATTATLPRPFREGRDGMALGEGAAIVALVREQDAANARFAARIVGFGASSDAVHITAPDREGRGLARAIARALDDAGFAPADVDLVSAHATATPFNDPAEASALRLALGGDARPVVHPFKAQIGHTLGGAGVLESLAACTSLERGVAPAAAGDGEPDPSCDVTLLDRAEPRPLRTALKLSAAFGGANAALLLSREPSRAPRRAVRPVRVAGAARIDRVPDLDALATELSLPSVKLARIDALGRLALGAVAALAREIGRERLRAAGIVAGHALATLETNDRYDARRRERGARFVEARRFPATSPNAAPGECAIAFGLTGPSFGVGASLHGGLEALAVAADLVRFGDAERMVVLAADDVGDLSRALLDAAGWPPLATGACALLLETGAGGAIDRSPQASGPGGFEELWTAIERLRA